MQILLLRHGRPSAKQTGWVRARDLPKVAAAYSAAGIDDRPPAAVLRQVRDCRHLVCSDLPRALQSAAALRLELEPRADDLFREMRIPHFTRGALRLPMDAWTWIVRLLLYLGYAPNGESLRAVKQRATQAAARLTELAETHGNVVLVGHGILNHFIARRLRAQNWSGPAKLSREYWGLGIYRYPA